MNTKHVKVGEFYNHAGFKVLVKSRQIEPKSGVVRFEVWAEEDQEPVFVSARKLSPLSTNF